MNELVPVPEAARDVNLTPSQRFEIIARAQPQMEHYQAPRGQPAVTRSGKDMTAITEHAQYLNRCRDKNGLVTAEQIVSGAGISAETSQAFTQGYQLPAGAKLDPIEAYNILLIAKRAAIPQQHVFNFLVEFSKYFA